jgi:hypothetical protein
MEKMVAENALKKRISAILEEFFLVGNVDKSHRMTAQDMWNLLNLKHKKEKLKVWTYQR